MARQQARLAINGVANMPRVLDPFRFLLITVAGCMNQRQLQMIDYLREENRVWSKTGSVGNPRMAKKFNLYEI
jgi:hypothetical protein